MSDSNTRFKVVVKAIIAALEANLAVVIQAAKDAHFAATHSESVAETKYDTFGLESSYLAQGQQKRVDEVNQALTYFLQLPLDNRQAPDSVEPPCLVELASESEHGPTDISMTRQFFVAPFAGGLTVIVNIDGIGSQEITVVTPASPVGQSLLTKMLDDEVSVMVKGKSFNFDVVEID